MIQGFLTVFLMLLSSGEIFAAPAGAWDCEKGGNGEWTCLNQAPGSQSAKPQAIKPQADAPQKPAAAVVTQVPSQNPMTKEKPVVAETPVAVEKNLPAEASTAPPAEPVAPPAQAELKKPQIKTVPEVEKLHVRVGEGERLSVKKLEPEPASQQPAPVKQTQAATRQTGWTCLSGNDKAADKKQGWNCNLVGSDPKGQAKQVADSSSDAGTYWLSRTFDHQQESRFKLLQAEFKEDPWQNCSSWSTRKRRIAGVSAEAREQAGTDVDADFSEVFDSNVLSFAGNVDLHRADQHLLADKASYDTEAETMDAQGNVLYSESTMALFSDTASLSLNKDEARLRKAMFILPEMPMRGSADAVYRENKYLTRYNQASFTSCPPGNQDWMAHAERVKINKDTGLGSAKNAWLEFKGVPMLYTPYISFPTDNRRTSGLLSPNFGHTQRGGFDFTAPYYWNIAPNLDATITPRYMTTRGGMLRSKLRYLTHQSEGSISGEILPYDQVTDSSRYSGMWKDKTRFTEHLSTDINLNYVSDKTYLNDLNNALGFQPNRYLPSTAYLNYGRPDVSFSAGIQHYQLIDKAVSTLPYDMLPRINFNLGHSFEELPIRVALDNQFTEFYLSSRPSDGSDTRKDGQRIHVVPSISAPLQSNAGFITPKAGFAFTQYQLNDPVASGLSTSITRALPILSLDSGLMFEKDYGSESSSPFTHTLEPRAFYLYIPRKDQSNIPLFDTAPYDTNFQSLFYENRFSGYDRYQDSNQVTLATTSRIIDRNTGLEPVRASVGQIIYFQDRHVTWTNVPDTTTTSNFIGELSGQVNKHWSYSLGGQWNPNTNGISRHQTYLRYREQPNLLFDVGFRYRQKDNVYTPQTISQSDISFRVPLMAEWYALGRWQYSLNFDKTTESFIGLEKENCCWRLRMIARRYINGAQASFNSSNITNNGLTPTTSIDLASAKPENAFFVQLELKGFTGLGSTIDQFLEQTLSGYRRTNYND